MDTLYAETEIVNLKEVINAQYLWNHIYHGHMCTKNGDKIGTTSKITRS